MAVEAELKGRLLNPDGVRAALTARAEVERAEYADTYYDDAERSLDRSQRELRIRLKTTSSGTRKILTFKDAPVDSATGSKPEHETEVTDESAVDAMLRALGYEPVIDFTKRCENYAFAYEHRQVLATVVTVPELDGTFLEVETISDESDVAAALAVLGEVLEDLGISEDALTTELYTEAVAARRLTDSDR